MLDGGGGSPSDGVLDGGGGLPSDGVLDGQDNKLPSTSNHLPVGWEDYFS